MKKSILSLIFTLAGICAFAQVPTSGVVLRVNDTTTYQAQQVIRHSQGYSDIYWNNQATTPHFDIWNGSSYDHVFDFNAGGGGSTPNLDEVLEQGSTATIATDYNVVTSEDAAIQTTGTGKLLQLANNDGGLIQLNANASLQGEESHVIATSGDAHVISNTAAIELSTTQYAYLHGGSTKSGELRLQEDSDNGSNYVGLIAPASIGTSYTITLPSAAGTANQILGVNSGATALEFKTASSGAALTVSSANAVVQTGGNASTALVNSASIAVYVDDYQSLTTATTLSASSPKNNYCDGTGGAFTVTLPPLSAVAAIGGGAGKVFTIKRIGASGTITIDPDGTEQIDGSSTSITITTNFNAITIQATPTMWMIISEVE